MPYIREEIRGTSPQDIKKMNDNMMNIWSKTFGDITYSDMDKDARTKVMTQWIPVQGEGNIDSTHPMYIRFYVPPNVQEVKSSNFNILISRYRMDSDVTSTQPSENVSSAFTSSSQPQYSVTSSSSASGVASVTGGQHSAYVKHWGTPPNLYEAPTADFGSNPVAERVAGNFYKTPGRQNLGTRPTIATYYGEEIEVVDLSIVQHTHEIQSHSHAISLSPHSHASIVPSHNHEVDIVVNIAGHGHDLNEGIKESKKEPTGVVMKINDLICSDILSGDSETQDNIDISSAINIGAWNIIKIESTGVSRATVYGTIEL